MKFSKIDWLKMLLLCLLVFPAGCEGPDLTDPETIDRALLEAVERDELQEIRVKGLLLLCIPGSEKPYTGWVKETYGNGQVKSLGHLKKGTKNELWVAWHENGRKREEIHFRDDVMDGPFSTWFPNGQKKAIGNIKEGEMDGRWSDWYENGRKSKVQNCKMGILISASVWMPDGEKCPVTGIVKGTGVLLEYNEDGTEKERHVFKDGVAVKD